MRPLSELRMTESVDVVGHLVAACTTLGSLLPLQRRSEVSADLQNLFSVYTCERIVVIQQPLVQLAIVMLLIKPLP